MDYICDMTTDIVKPSFLSALWDCFTYANCEGDGPCVVTFTLPEGFAFDYDLISYLVYDGTLIDAVLRGGKGYIDTVDLTMPRELYYKMTTR
jgi:hypothetical protein